MKQIMIERRNPLFAVIRDANHEQSMVNEDDIDFRIRGLPHSVVKQADNDRVRELVKKIENHLTDYLVNKIYNRTVYDPFSMNPKKMIQDMGQLWSCLDCSRLIPRRSAKNAFHTGVKASSDAHAGLLKESAANRGVIQQT